MATQIPDSPPAFRLDGTLRVVSTLLTIIGVILVVYGLTLPFMLPSGPFVEAPFLSTRSLLAALLRIVVGTLLFLGARGLRRGRRYAAAIIVISAIAISINALVVRGWSGLEIVLVAGILLAPLIPRWRTLS